MPLRDHFRSPLDDIRSWDELHGMLPAIIVRQLTKVLPEPYYAGPGVCLGRYEVNIGTFESRPALGTKNSTSETDISHAVSALIDGGGLAVMTMPSRCGCVIRTNADSWIAGTTRLALVKCCRLCRSGSMTTKQSDSI